MQKSQVKLLTSIAKEIQGQKKDRAKIVVTFKSAKILTEKENFTKQYSNLKKVVSK